MKTEFENNYEEEFDLPGLEDDRNRGNKYYISRTQLDGLYAILLDSIASTVVEVESDLEDNDQMKWRFMTDSEMLAEVKDFQAMPENQDERHTQMLRLLYEVLSQRLPTSQRPAEPRKRRDRFNKAQLN